MSLSFREDATQISSTPRCPSALRTCGKIPLRLLCRWNEWVRSDFCLEGENVLLEIFVGEDLTHDINVIRIWIYSSVKGSARARTHTHTYTYNAQFFSWLRLLWTSQCIYLSCISTSNPFYPQINLPCFIISFSKCECAKVCVIIFFLEQHSQRSNHSILEIRWRRLNLHLFNKDYTAGVKTHVINSSALAHNGALSLHLHR